MNKQITRGETSIVPQRKRRKKSEGVAVKSSSGQNIDAAIEELGQVENDLAFSARWTELQALFPDHLLLWNSRVQWLIRGKHFDEAIECISQRDIDDFDEDALALKANLLYDARAFEHATELFDQIIERFSDRRDLRLNFAKRLFADGHLKRAHTMIAPVAHTLAEGTKSRALWDRADGILRLLEAREGRVINRDEDARIISMKHAILHFHKREPEHRSSGELGRLTLVTGSLGPGGAERQLTRLAVELERARRTTGELAGIALNRPVEVLVRSWARIRWSLSAGSGWRSRWAGRA